MLSLLLSASLGLNIYLFREANYFADRALAEQQLRKDEAAQYGEWLNEFQTRFEELKRQQRERDELILRHEQVRPVP